MEENTKLSKNYLIQCAGALIISGIISVLGNWAGYEHLMPLESIPGILILIVIALVGIVISKFIGNRFPSFLHVSIVGILVSMPWCPLSGFVVEYTSKIQLMAVVTPILAYSGLTVGRDWRAFTKIGWKAILVGCVVIFGTFFWSALIAEVLLKVQGTI